MSDPDLAQRLLRWIGRGFAILLVAFIGMVVLINVGFEGQVGATIDILWHLTTGFVRFLEKNLKRVSSDAGTWGPGLAAFSIAVFIGHRFLRSWFHKSRRPWSLLSTACLALLLPVLFTISFLVPGVLLMLRGPNGTSWFEDQPREVLAAESQVSAIRQVVGLWQSRHRTGEFPPSLAALVESELVDEAILRPLDPGDPLADPPIYLGGSLTADSEPSLPLVISSSYEELGTRRRIVLTVGGDFETITDEELDRWIDKAVYARDGVKP